MRTNAILTALLTVTGLAAQAPVRFDAGTISGLPARNIGSGVLSSTYPSQSHLPPARVSPRQRSKWSE